MKHSEKVKIARGMMSKEEAKKGEGLFTTKAWESRKKAIAERVTRKQTKK